MNKQKKRFFQCSFAAVAVVCIVVFACLSFFMSHKTEETIKGVSSIYMSEMNTQIQQKFTSIISLRLSQVTGIIQSTTPEEYSPREELIEELKTMAEVRGFSGLGFYSESGEVEIVYGEEVTLVDNAEALQSLEADGTIVAQGIDQKGENILALGQAAQYEMEDGKTSAALIAFVSMEYLNQALFLDSEDTDIYSYIIDSEGHFVIRSTGDFQQSYFDHIRVQFDEQDGKTPEDYVKEFQEAIAANSDYMTSASFDGDEHYVYCSPISKNYKWYLITMMSSSVMEENITSLDRLRTLTTTGCAAAIILMVSALFALYYRLLQQQMKELHRAKKEAERANKAKSAFLSSMSHDIRTPMNAIMGMTEIALRNVTDATRLEECLRKIKLSSKHLLGLINDVLDMSKIESGKMTLDESPMSLRETMDDVVNIIQPQVKSRNQYFDIFIRDIISEEVYCDGVRLNQVLINLLSNALKFTPELGRIDMHVFQEESPLGGEYVRTHFRVVDTGIGMSEEFQTKIWDTFTREDTEDVAHTAGTGLGMSITKSIVDLMKGTIELKSQQGKGSDFHIILDLKKADLLRDEEMKLPPWNILVVDDNELLCISAVANLEELGVHAEWTLDGRKAVKMIREHHDSGDDYHFVLIDWKMPNMDGLQTIHEIRKHVGKDIPLFLISAYDWGDIEEEASRESIEGFISKPLFTSVLYDRLRKYMDGYEETREREEEGEVNFTGRHVLLSEDIDLNWEVANEILSVTGMQIDRAVNGKECVEKFASSAIGYYDAILMDIRMPVMNGYDATKTIRAMKRPDKDLPIIAMTADAFSDDAQYCMECGMNAHIPKPIDVKECMRTLSKFLD